MFEPEKKKHTKGAKTETQQTAPSDGPDQKIATEILKSPKLLQGTKKPFKRTQNSPVKTVVTKSFILAGGLTAVTRYFSKTAPKLAQLSKKSHLPNNNR